MKKLAIIGASYLQEPLIQKAKQMGLETHVFAWKCGDVGEQSADFFYPISIVEKDEILKKCQEIGVDGVCSIASDLAAITVNYVANKMGLIGNSEESVKVSTNKHFMRKCFEKNGDPSPVSIKVNSIDEFKSTQLTFPVIIKPLDRSGSRGITKTYDEEEVSAAIEYAKNQGFEKAALIEEFAMGQEYSVEYISWKGQHHFLAMTKKYTTGAPHFIETGHVEPAPVDEETLENVKRVVEHALSSLMIENGASHSEIKINDRKEIKIIEIGGRMGGDFIGSNLVELSTGFDFVGNVIRIAMEMEPVFHFCNPKAAAVRFVFNKKDVEILKIIKEEHPEYLVAEEVHTITENEVTDSASRFGYYIFSAPDLHEIEKYLPAEKEDE